MYIFIFFIFLNLNLNFWLYVASKEKEKRTDPNSPDFLIISSIYVPKSNSSWRCSFVLLVCKLKLDEDRSKEGGGFCWISKMVLAQHFGIVFAQLRLVKGTPSPNTCEREREREREREECNKYDLTDLLAGERQEENPNTCEREECNK